MEATKEVKQGFQKTRIGWVPDDWRSLILGDIAKFSKGKGISKNDVTSDGTIPCVRYGELYTDYKEVIEKVHSYTNLNDDELVFSEKNDVIIPASGETAIDIATASCVLNSGIALGGDLNIIKTDENGVYLSYYLNNVKKNNIARLAQGVSVSHVYSNQLKLLKLNLPSVEEQKKISKILSTWDQAIEYTTNLMEQLKLQKKGLMQQLLTGKKRLKGFDGDLNLDFNIEVIDDVKEGFQKTKIGWVPDDWEIKTLGEIGETVNGLTYSPKDIDENGVLVLRSSNVQNGQIVFDDNVFVLVEDGKYNPVLENDILICVRNGSRSLIGKNALISLKSEGLAFGAFMAIYRSPLNKYIIHLLDTDLYNREIHKNLGATINSINGSDLRKFKFPIPPQGEQQKIASILSTWDQGIEDTTNLIEQLKLQKKGLMQQLLTGQKRVSVN